MTALEFSLLDDEVDMTNLADPLLALSAMLMLLLSPFSVVATNLANLPDQPAAAPEEAPVTIGFDAQGGLFWNREAVSSDELVARLADLKQSEAAPIVYLAGDRDAKYEVSLEIKAALADLGLEVQELVNSTSESTE
jgi:biopolymer transport protein ExbD